MNKPILYAGKRLPLADLSWEAFEDFVYVCLHEIGPLHGFRVNSKPAATGDEGFDVRASRMSDGEQMCIQAKRYDVISIPEVALELSKVAFNSALEEVSIVEHYIVASGKVRKKLRKAIQDSNRTILLQKTVEVCQNDKSLEGLRTEIFKKGLVPAEVAASYVRALDKLVVWSGSEFDSQLGRVWSRLEDAIERCFTVHKVLSEHPRPDFHEDEYLSRIAGVPPAYSIPARAREGLSPWNVVDASAADPLAGTSPTDTQSAAEHGGSQETIVVVSLRQGCVNRAARVSGGPVGAAPQPRG